MGFAFLAHSVKKIQEGENKVIAINLFSIYFFHPFLSVYAFDFQNVNRRVTEKRKRIKISLINISDECLRL